MPRILLLFACLFAFAARAQAQLHIRDICRVKGQEENTLQGLGLVVGLKGTGDGDIGPTTRALARTMQLLGASLPTQDAAKGMLEELKDAKNVALVFVSATVPASGGRQGDKVDCTVSAISAKSLEGGYLMTTPLVGPRPGADRVYALAQGQIDLENIRMPAGGKVYNGCRLEESIQNEYVQNDKITLVLLKNHAGFQTAQDVAELINGQPDFRDGSTGEDIAIARDQVNIEITIPEKYRQSPVLFVSLVLNQRMYNPQNAARVVINERSGTVVIGASVEIGPVAVTHKNIVIEAGGSQFVPLDPASDSNTTKLKALVEALNAIKVPTEDMIDIIKGLEANGDLYGHLIIDNK